MPVTTRMEHVTDESEVHSTLSQACRFPSTADADVCRKKPANESAMASPPAPHPSIDPGAWPPRLSVDPPAQTCCGADTPKPEPRNVSNTPPPAKPRTGTDVGRIEVMSGAEYPSKARSRYTPPHHPATKTRSRLSPEPGASAHVRLYMQGQIDGVQREGGGGKGGKEGGRER